MRTKDQIENLRNVLTLMYGGFARFLTDEAINIWADKLQDRLDEMKVWEIKTKLVGSEHLSWADIEPEPKTPCCTKEDIEDKCWSLLISYPRLLAVHVCELDTKLNEKEFSR